MAKTGPDMQRVPEFNVGDLASPKARHECSHIGGFESR